MIILMKLNCIFKGLESEKLSINIEIIENRQLSKRNLFTVKIVFCINLLTKMNSYIQNPRMGPSMATLENMLQKIKQMKVVFRHQRISRQLESGSCSADNFCLWMSCSRRCLCCLKLIALIQKVGQSCECQFRV